jgi:hypothetical protein
MSHDLATPESLEQLADDHTSAGLLISAATFRAMAKSWRATERALADAQAENSRLALSLQTASATAARLEVLAASVLNTLCAAGARPSRPVESQPGVPA